MPTRDKPFDCPVCGEEVPANARACPECGACEKSGWSDDLGATDLGVGEEDFDYEDFVAKEFGGGAKKSPVQWVWWAVGVLLIVLLLLALR